MLSDAYEIVSKAAFGAKVVFQKMFDAIPGFAGAIAVMFLASLVISLIIMPLRGSAFLIAAGSDWSKPKSERSSTKQTLDDAHKRMAANAAFTSAQKKPWNSSARKPFGSGYGRKK